ncbi:hypothetical protein FSC37_08515 [Piscinibacter aquaticus]|uniref:Uncharacterized protein n=1 Tax=Piscinibacter aquaticus TaxID=392597 RepID=A0A5C6TZ26_9BURK|nr:hypothetical protein FSC37_08515 [Piscinibacter aquaticus]
MAMLESLKRLFAGKPTPAAAWADVADWSARRALNFRRVREGEGFVIEGLLDDRPWRLEWGRRSASTSPAANFACAWSSICRATCRCCC